MRCPLAVGEADGSTGQKQEHKDSDSTEQEGAQVNVEEQVPVVNGVRDRDLDSGGCIGGRSVAAPARIWTC